MQHKLARACAATALAAAVTTLATLAACGGGGSSSSGSFSSSQQTPTSIGGTVATGNALVGAVITVHDASGTTATTTTDTSGNYTLSLKGLNAPLMLVATDPSGQHAPLYSVVAKLPNSTQPAIVNVTTLTSALAAMLTASGNPADLLTNNAFTSVSTVQVSAATITLDAILADLFKANGLSSVGYDPIFTAFTPNRTGVDAVIDTIALVSTASGATSLISNAAPNAPVVLNNKTTLGATLAVPAVASNYLDALPALLTACFANTPVTSACSPAIASGFLDHGSSDLAVSAGGSDASFTGAQFGNPRTLEFFTQGGQSRALVSLPYTLDDGTTGQFVTIAQPLATPVALAGGGTLTWNLIGDQSAYPVTISPQIQRRTFADTRLTDVSRYEAGLQISIPLTASASGVYSASVTGPGLANPVWMLPRNASGNNTLALSATTLATPPVSPATTATNTSLYALSWQVLSTSTSFTPTTTSGLYAPQAVDAASLPLYASYTVAFYNASGALIGQSSIVNAGTVVNASTGGTIGWPTVVTSLISDFLTPGGATSSAQYAMTVQWSTLIDNVDTGYQVSKVQIQAAPATGAVPGAAIDGFSVGTPTQVADGQYLSTISSGIDQTGAETCTNCPFPALATGGSRRVILGGGRPGLAYYDVHEYRD